MSWVACTWFYFRNEDSTLVLFSKFTQICYKWIELLYCAWTLRVTNIIYQKMSNFLNFIGNRPKLLITVQSSKNVSPYYTFIKNVLSKLLWKQTKVRLKLLLLFWRNEGENFRKSYFLVVIHIDCIRTVKSKDMADYSWYISWILF